MMQGDIVAAGTRKASASGDEQNIAEVGNWARDKLALLREYTKISTAARKKFVGRSEATYIDLVWGPGQSSCRRPGAPRDGSPSVAWEASVASGMPFSREFVADASPQSLRSG